MEENTAVDLGRLGRPRLTIFFGTTETLLAVSRSVDNLPNVYQIETEMCSDLPLCSQLLL